MDGGSNCHILLKEEHFIYFVRKFIPCSLANGIKSGFHGIGVAVAELEPGFPVLLAPCYYSKTDDVCTLSPGALINYSGCSTASHSLFKHLKVTKDGKTIRSKVETVGGLDYKKISICHFNKALKTKIGRNSYLAIKPPRFLFKSGQYPTGDQEDSTNKPSNTNNSKELSTEEEVKVPKVDTKTDNNKNISSRGRVRKARKITTVQSFDQKHYSTQCQIVPQANALQIKNRRKTLLATYLHRKFGCQCMEGIQLDL